jgi:hypothetical protein
MWPQKGQSQSYDKRESLKVLIQLNWFKYSGFSAEDIGIVTIIPFHSVNNSSLLKFLHLNFRKFARHEPYIFIKAT